jgi:N-acetylneuraminic acid mutarotase
MSAAFEARLLITCGRENELGQIESRSLATLPKMPQAMGTDVLVNDPTGETHPSATQSETSLARNENTGVLCSTYNDAWSGVMLGTGFTGFSHSDDDGATWIDHGPVGIDAWGDPANVWRRADGHFYHASLHTSGLGLWDLGAGCTSSNFVGMIHTGGGDDKELMAVDNNPASPYYGRLYVAWTDFNAGAQIYVTYSDNTIAWSTPVTVSLPGISSHGAWPAVDPATGDVYVAWVRWNPYPNGPIDIEIVRSTNGGNIFNFVTNPMTGQVNPLDATATITNCARPALNGDIRYLPSPQIVVDHNSNLHVVYSYDPDGYDTGDVINVYYRRSTDQGATWEPEIQLNDDFTGTDQWFPALAVADDGTVGTFWYDRRLDFASNYMFDYYKAVSYDNGVTFQANERVSDQSSPVDLDPGLATCYHGDYDTSVAGNGRFFIQWSADQRGDADIYLDTEPATLDRIVGTVYDVTDLRGLEGAGVEATLQPTGTLYYGTAGIGGYYEIYASSGSYDVTAMAYGYQPNTVAVVVASDVQADIPLTSVPSYIVEGDITDASTGYPVHAHITVTGDPFDPPPPNHQTWSNALTGYYDLTLASNITYTFIVEAEGYFPVTRTVGPLTANAIEDFALTPDLVACTAPGYEQLPIFYDGFETGSLGPDWSTTTITEGRVTVSTTYPYAGDYSVLLDDTTANITYSLASLTLAQDLSSPSNVALNFWWREFGDEDDAEDGVFFSDDYGANWVTATQFAGDQSTFTRAALDVDAIAAANGLTLNDHFWIKFQFYDNYPIPADGYAVDQVRLHECQVATDAVLQPDRVETEDCPCTPQVHHLTFVNHTGIDDEVLINYTTSPSVTVMEMPTTLGVIPDGGIRPFETVVKIDSDTPNGATVYVTVTASLAGSPAISATTVIQKRATAWRFDDAWVDQPSNGDNLGVQWAAWGVTDHIYTISGLDAVYNTVLTTTRYYDESTGNWVDTGDTVPVPVHGPAGDGIVRGDEIWLLGGFPTSGFIGGTSIQYYDTAIGSWNTLSAPPWVARGGAFGGTANGNLYIMSGYDDSIASTYTDTWEYAPDSGVWTQLDDFPYTGFISPGALFGCSVSMNWNGTDYIYVGGDYGGTKNWWRFDPTQPSGSQWTQLADIPADAGSASQGCVAKEGKIFLYGGSFTGLWSNIGNTLWEYDPDSDTWQGPFPQALNTARVGFGAVLFKNGLWTYAGSDGTTIDPITVERLGQNFCPDCLHRLEIRKDGPEWVYPGDVAHYGIRLVNTGECTVTANLTDVVPSDAYYADDLSCSDGTCWYDGGDDAVYWNGEVPAYDAVTLTFGVTATTVSTWVVNTAIAEYSGTACSAAVGYGPTTVKTKSEGDLDVNGGGAIVGLEYGVGEEMSTNRGTMEISQPMFYRYLSNDPSRRAPSALSNILLCSDSVYLVPPNTCAEAALQNLGQSYTLYYSDWAGCETAINSGTYDVAIIDNANSFLAESLFTALNGFLLGGGQVMVNTFDMDAYPTNPLWATAGVSYTADVVAAPPPPVYRWQPDHPLVDDWAADPLQFDNNYIDDGDKFDALVGAQLLAGYTAVPQIGEGALALRNDNRAVVSGFCLDNLATIDQDGDGISDCVTAWQSGIARILPRFVADTHKFRVNQPPVITWTKNVYVNGTWVGEPEDGPFTVVADDAVQIVDTLAYTGTFPLFAYVSEDWNADPLELVAESHAHGAVNPRPDGLDWGVTLLPSADERLIRTFHVTDTATIAIAEWLAPDEIEPYSRTLALEPPQFTKDGPAEANPDDVISYTIVFRTRNGIWGTTVMTDAMPLGVAFADALTATYGTAWYSDTDNAIYWTNTTPPALASLLGESAAPVSTDSSAAPKSTGDISGSGVPASVGALSVRSAEGYATLAATGLKVPLAPSATWFDASPLPPGDGGVVRYAHAQCPGEMNRFYVISGVDESFSDTANTWRYDADTDTWIALAPLPVAVEGPSAVCYAGHIYVAGGDGTDQFYIYDIVHDTWSAGATLPRYVWGAAMGAWDGQIYMIGGDSDFTFGDVSDEVNVYDIVTDNWVTTGTSMLTATETSGWVQAGQYVYIVGGWGNSSPTSNVTATQRYDMASDTWEVGPVFPSGRGDLALAITEQNLYAIGGDADGGGAFDAVTTTEALDLSAWPGGTWTDIGDPLSVGLTANNAGFCTEARADGEVWSVGGYTGSSITGTNQYRPSESCLGIPSVVTITFSVTVTAEADGTVINTAEMNYHGTRLTADTAFTEESPIIYLPLVMRNYGP